MKVGNLDSLKFDDKGLIPAVVQDWRDGTILMVAYMNREALNKTLETEIAHFWSRSRQELWEKGATSGHRQHVRAMFVDCDRDTVLISVTPDGPACHTGERSCFFARISDSTDSTVKTAEARGGVLDRISETIQARKRQASSDSYVAALLTAGQDQILKKVTEEAGEVILASKGGKREEEGGATTGERIKYPESFSTLRGIVTGKKGDVEHYERKDFIGLPLIASNLCNLQGHKRGKVRLQWAQQRLLHVSKRIEVLIDLARRSQAREYGYDGRKCGKVGRCFVKRG